MLLHKHWEDVSPQENDRHDDDVQIQLDTLHILSLGLVSIIPMFPNQLAFVEKIFNFDCNRERKFKKLKRNDKYIYDNLDE